MPTIQSSVSVASNATIENVFAGSQFEFAPYNATIEIAVLGAVVGVVADVSTGQDVVAENMSVPNKAGFPVIPDDFTVQDVVRAGERVKLRLRNTTGAAIVVNFCMRMFPVR